MIKREKYTFLFIVLGCISLNFIYSPLSPLFFDDKEIFNYAGQLIYRGAVPYKDMFDHKPPLIYFLNFFNWISPWIFWLLDTLMVLSATLLFYSLCKKNKLAWPWFLPLLFNLMIRNSLTCFGNGMTREYTTIFILMFFCVMQGQSGMKYYLLGLLTGLIFWMQQDAIITLLPFLFYTIFISEKTPTIGIENSPPGIWTKILPLTTGFLSISLPLILYFQFHHSLTYLWNNAFLFNMQAKRVPKSVFTEIKTIKHALHESEYEMAFYTSLILGIAAIFLKNQKKTLLRLSLLALLLSFAGEFISGRLSAGNAFIYYLLPLSATVPITIYIVFTQSTADFLLDRTCQLIFNIILSATLFMGICRYATNIHFLGDSYASANKLPIIEYLNKQSLSDYQLFVFDDSNLIYLYNKNKIRAPSRWIYHYFYGWYPDWDQDKSIFHSIISELQTHQTTWILDCSDANGNLANREIYLEWKCFLNAHYTMMISDSSKRMLWKMQ